MIFQVIFASSLNSQLRTFGWSLSGGMDIDENKYPDLLVGAYESGHAVSMSSAPVAHMTASVNFDVSSKQIDLEDQRCRLRDRTPFPACRSPFLSATPAPEFPTRWISLSTTT